MQSSIADDIGIILPEQLVVRMSFVDNGQPERELMFAVLVDAVLCLQGTSDARRSEVENWIRASDDTSLFSFKNVCETLGFDPQCLRRGLLKKHHPRAAQLGLVRRGEPKARVRSRRSKS